MKRDSLHFGGVAGVEPAPCGRYSLRSWPVLCLLSYTPEKHNLIFTYHFILSEVGGVGFGVGVVAHFVVGHEQGVGAAPAVVEADHEGAEEEAEGFVKDEADGEGEKVLVLLFAKEEEGADTAEGEQADDAEDGFGSIHDRRIVRGFPVLSSSAPSGYH